MSWSVTMIRSARDLVLVLMLTTTVNTHMHLLSFVNPPVCEKAVGLCVRTRRRVRLSPGRCWTLKRVAGQYTAETSKKHLREKLIRYLFFNAKYSIICLNSYNKSENIENHSSKFFFFNCLSCQCESAQTCNVIGTDATRCRLKWKKESEREKEREPDLVE